MRTLVVGDIHGGYKSLLQVLERAKFDKENEELISLGDVCDGWPEVKECIEYLLSCKHLVFILGNHDKWAIDWMENDWQGREWVEQGGRNTLKSFKYERKRAYATLGKLYEFSKPYHLRGKQLFVHGGIDPNKPLYRHSIDEFMWDRELVASARNSDPRKPDLKYGGYDEIFVGHTSTTYTVRGPDRMQPTKYCNVWMMDTGGGYEGKLSVMDVDTKAWWQSDMVRDFYPDECL